MNDINTLYYNDFGIAFQWKRCAAKDFKKVQLVFRNTGFFLTEAELIQFHKNVKRSLDSQQLCSDCKHNGTCRSLLLQTPANQISLAMSLIELQDAQDLIKGTIAQLELEHVFKANNISRD
ncbi:hypothetical protein [uncultured Psychroserpens sp.]|uniref:hypothetical protein n=1 Tax=uncultured Psychroserpens sp. TaxID=255436 RepID=UPI00262C18C1|nr:hypothetical protein [uncultured Psychroserpens sp.]